MLSRGFSINIRQAVYFFVFAAGIVLGFLTVPMSKKCFIDFSYYLTLLLYVVYALALSRFLAGQHVDLKTFFSKYKLVLLFSLLICAVTFSSVKPQLVVSNDEQNLLLTSKNLFLDKKADISSSTLRINDRLVPVQREVAHRPCAFPFLTALIHALRGYKVENVFILNFIVLFILFSIVGVVLHRKWGLGTALSGILLVSAQPLVSLVATSGHYDLFFAVCVAILLLGLYFFLTQPSQLSFDFFLASLLLLALVRHEAFLHAGIVFGLLLVFRKLPFSYLSNSFVFAFVPLLFLQDLWHFEWVRNLATTTYKDVDHFSIRHFLRQNGQFFSYLFRFDFYYPYASIINIVALAGGILLAAQGILRRGVFDANKKIFAVITAVFLCGYWIFFTSMWWAGFDDATSCRFYLFFMVILSVTAVIFLRRVLAGSRLGSVLIIVFSLGCWILYHPVAINKAMYTAPYQKRLRTYYVADFLNGRADRDFVLITEGAQKFAVYDYGAVSFWYANRHKEKLLWYRKNKYFNDIYVYQVLDPKTKQPTKETSLDKAYTLKILAEKRFPQGRTARISLVTNP